MKPSERIAKLISESDKEFYNECAIDAIIQYLNEQAERSSCAEDTPASKCPKCKEYVHQCECKQHPDKPECTCKHWIDGQITGECKVHLDKPVEEFNCDRCSCDLKDFRLCPNCTPKDKPSDNTKEIGMSNIEWLELAIKDIKSAKYGDGVKKINFVIERLS